MEVKELVEQMQTASTEIKNLIAAQASEIKSVGTVSAETKAALAETEKKFADLQAKFATMDTMLSDLQAKNSRPGAGQPERKTLGELFVASEIYAGVKSASRGNGQPLEIDRKSITSLTASAGSLIRPDRDPEVYSNPKRPMRIRDLIPTIPTQSGSVEVMRQNVFTNNAGPQTASGDNPSGAIGGGELQAKNQSNITWSLETYPVRTIAHWVPASRQALSDAPMLRSLIDTELTYGLDLESDAQLLLGDGTGQNVTGIMVDADVSDIGGLAAGTTTADIPSAMIDHIRSAVTTCQTFEYYNVNGVVLNPIDWEKIETAKATDGHYLMLTLPQNGAEPRVWRIPVIVTNAMPAGDFLLGDWVMGAKVYDRESVTVRVSESHADYFVKNGVAVLAEERYTLAVNRPKAFCKGSFDVEAS
jgi:HK97 family phage major capsid protein